MDYEKVKNHCQEFPWSVKSAWNYQRFWKALEFYIWRWMTEGIVLARIVIMSIVLLIKIFWTSFKGPLKAWDMFVEFCVKVLGESWTYLSKLKPNAVLTNNLLLFSCIRLLKIQLWEEEVIERIGVCFHSHSVVELHEATEIFVMVGYVREMTVKKFCKYGEYKSFEHLLFLFIYLYDLTCIWSCGHP